MPSLRTHARGHGMQSGRAVCRRPARRTGVSLMSIAIRLIVRKDQRRTLEGPLGLAFAFDPPFFDIPNHRCGAGLSRPPRPLDASGRRRRWPCSPAIAQEPREGSGQLQASQSLSVRQTTEWLANRMRCASHHPCSIECTAFFAPQHAIFRPFGPEQTQAPGGSCTRGCKCLPAMGKIRPQSQRQRPQRPLRLRPEQQRKNRFTSQRHRPQRPLRHLSGRLVVGTAESQRHRPQRPLRPETTFSSSFASGSQLHRPQRPLRRMPLLNESSWRSCRSDTGRRGH